MTDLETLALRCEQATGPDRELDREIEPILGFIPADATPCRGGWIIDGTAKDSPRYTASIDAAMTLVPEDSGMSFAKSVSARGGWSVALYDENVMAGGATRALALCAAALRSRVGQDD